MILVEVYFEAASFISFDWPWPAIQSQELHPIGARFAAVAFQF